MAAYEIDARIRYSEVDRDGLLSTTALIDLFQNCSTFQSEDLGYGLKHLWEHNKAWVLSSWQIQIDKLPRLGDYVKIRTWSTGVRMSLGNRNFALYNQGDELLACAKTLWVYIDMETAKPTKVPVEMIEAYGADAAIDMKEYPRKIALPENMNDGNSFEVPFFYIDTNNHMNNSKYIEAAMEYVPDSFKISTIRTEYKKQARFKDVIHSKIAINDNVITVAMYDDNGDAYSYVQFISD